MAETANGGDSSARTQLTVTIPTKMSHWPNCRIRLNDPFGVAIGKRKRTEATGRETGLCEDA